MNKTELVAAIANNAEISKKDAEKALKAVVDVITDELKKGEKVQLVGNGIFYFRVGKPAHVNPSQYGKVDAAFVVDEVSTNVIIGRTVGLCTRKKVERL